MRDEISGISVSGSKMTVFPETLDEGCGGGHVKRSGFLDGLIVMSSQVYMNMKNILPI